VEKLKPEFEEAMFNVYRRAKDKAGYTANIFLQMLIDRHGINLARADRGPPRSIISH
jgi:hypothetical protein